MRLEFVPMNGDDLDWVTHHERELHAFPWTHGNFSDSFAAGYSTWIARRGIQRVGYAVVMMVLDEAHLLNISVVRDAQRQGIGRAMLDHIIESARRSGAQQMFLEVRPSNLPALTMYETFGFRQIGRRRGYYPAEEGREDALVMRLGL